MPFKGLESLKRTAGHGMRKLLPHGMTSKKHFTKAAQIAKDEEEHTDNNSHNHLNNHYTENMVESYPNNTVDNTEELALALQKIHHNQANDNHTLQNLIKELIKTAKFVLDCGSSGSFIPGITPKSTSGNCSFSLSEK